MTTREWVSCDRKCSECYGIGGVVEACEACGGTGRVASEYLGGSGYPNCDRLDDNAEAKEAIEGFLEFLESRGIFLCEQVEGGADDHFARFVASSKRPEALVMDYFGIDRAELERERRAILAKEGP